VRFVEFLKTTVLLCAGAATALAAVTVIGAGERGETQPALISIIVWILAVAAGQWLGRRTEAIPPVARLLAAAKATTTLPENRPGAVIINRLWPLLGYTIVAGGLAFLAPQIPGVAAVLPIVMALQLRNQHAAVAAIEERDGARFYVARVSPLRPIALERTPGFKALRPEGLDGATG
jgi:hypothetical protein